jgi:WD40 repeat protein
MRGGVAIASFASGHLQVYRLEINELLMCIAAHTRAITQICLHPSQPLVAVCSEDQHISVWSVPDLGSCGALEVRCVKGGVDTILVAPSLLCIQLSLLYTDVVEHCLFTGVAFVRDGSSKIIAIGYDKETLMVWARD